MARLLVVFALFAAAAQADGLVQALQGRDPTKAARALKEALERSPKPKDLLAATAPVHWPALRRIAGSGQAGRTAVQHLLRLVRRAFPPRRVNEQTLARLVQVSIEHEKYTPRFDASMRLARRYGTLAVPPLVKFLSSQTTEFKINAHITLMNRLGERAVMPLLLVVRNGDADQRRLVALELSGIGDPRALAALVVAAATDPSAEVRAQATRARDKLIAKFPWAKGKTPAELHVDLAARYHEGRSGDAPVGEPIVWRWQGGLVARPVAPSTYLSRVAEQAAAEAVRLEPNNGRAKALLADIREKRDIADALVTELR